MDKAIPENNSWQKIIYKHALDGVMIINAENWRVVAVNPNALLILDDNVELVVGQDSRTYFIEQRLPENTKSIQQVGEYYHFLLLTKYGKQIPVLKKSVHITLKGTPFILEIFIAISNINSAVLVDKGQYKLAEALHETAKALNQSLNFHEMLDLILHYTGQVVPYDAANIMLIDNGNARMVACLGYEKLGGAERVMGMVRVIDDVPNLRHMAESGQPIVVSDTRQSPDWIDTGTSSWIRSYVSAPICNQGHTIGYLNLNSATPGFYQSEHAERLLAFASQAAIAITNARLFESAQNEISDRKRIEADLQEAKNELEGRVLQRTQELTQELIRRQQAEANLEKERSRLAMRVQERTAELKQANVELAKSAQLKDAFLASMSHELRTPLNAILNISESLQELVYGELSSAQMRTIHLIEESGQHLLTLINDILDLSKIGAGKFELVKDYTSVETLCEASLKLVDELAKKKHLIVTFNRDPQVEIIWADTRRLKQVLVNLLSNSIKFTPPGGSIVLMVVADVESNQARFIVSDTGIGISDEGIQQLFKPFIQLDNNLARQFEGTGLGLALAYRIVELHGGAISVSSEVGKGSNFTVKLDWQPKMTQTQGLTSSQHTKNHSGDDPEEAGILDPMLKITWYLNELGMEVINDWILPDDLMLWNETNRKDGIIIIDQHLLPHGDEGNRKLCAIGLTRQWPVIIIGSLVDASKFEHLPGNISAIQEPFDRKDVRTVIKKTSPDGTASLIRRAVILREQVVIESQNQSQILIVDDNETALRVVGEYLRAKGYCVHQANNGLDAIHQAQDVMPDLILMDIQMPGIDGLEVIRRIRADDQLQIIPIVALTALAMPGDRAICLAAGANDYLSKPISLNELVDVIQKYTCQKISK